MIQKKFSISDAFSLSVKIVMDNFWFLFKASLLMILAFVGIIGLYLAVESLIFYVDLKEIVKNAIALKNYMTIVKLALPVFILIFLAVILMMVGWIKITLDLHDNKTVGYSHLYKFYYLVPRMLALCFITMFAIIIGLCLLIVPGIIILLRLRFAAYFMVDKNQSVMQSLRSSWDMTEGSVKYLAGYAIVATLLGFASRNLLYFFVSQADANLYRQVIKQD